MIVGLLFFCQSILAQNDSLNSKVVKLKEVVVLTNRSLKTEQKNGKYEVYVNGTSFQGTQNTWEGLKQIPMLRVNEGSGLKVNNKTAIIEINGVQTQMTGSDLENYLKSLDPKSIKKIEINSNPNASYGSEINAVINIILSQKQDSYRLGINTTSGINNFYFNNSGVNYAINGKKIRLYSNYNLAYSPKLNTSEVSQQIGVKPLLNIKYNENQKLLTHQGLININFDITKKDQIDLTQVGSFGFDDKVGISSNSSFEKKINLNLDNVTLQFAQVWKHSVNDSVSYRFGSYQAYKTSISNNYSVTNTTYIENQSVRSNIPIFIGFFDYSNKNKLGTTSAGLRYNQIEVKNENNTVLESKVTDSPFNYKEKVFASYLNHTFDISPTKSFSMGFRTESSFIDYEFSNSILNQVYSNSRNYTNLLFNASYNWTTKLEWNNGISLRSQIQRPNYNSLNPFKSISSDVIYFSGESQISPSKNYSLTYELGKNDWSFYLQTGVIDNFISSIFKVDNNAITQTYRNFNKLYFVGLGAEYNKDFFEKKWITKTGLDVNYYKVNDSDFIFDYSTPSINLTTINVIELGNKFKLNLNYSFNSNFKDGLIKHNSTQKLDLVFSRKMSGNFTMMLFAYDILKTSYVWEETTIPNYFYSSKYYNNVRSFGITLKWNITGKSYKGRLIEQPKDNSIERL